MHLRTATANDEVVLREWLQNREECMLVTNKSEFNSNDYLSWLEAEDQRCYFLINEDQQYVGYGEIWVDESQKDLEFAHLIINPSMRNKGFGKMLIRLLEEKAKLIDFPMIYLRVNPHNQQAINCYIKCNYSVDPSLNEIFEKKWTWLKKCI